jgi:hypothetical protein
MTTLREAERAVATIIAKRERVAARIASAVSVHQQLSYAAIVENDRDAGRGLAKINADIGELERQALDLDAARVHADRLLHDAQQAVAKTEAGERVQRIGKLLDEIEGCGPKLDEGTGVKRGDSAAPMSDGVAWRYRYDPPLQARTATLVGSVLVEFKLLGLAADARFPSHQRWDLNSREDLLRAFTDMVANAWPFHQLSSTERGSFAALLAAFAKLVRRQLEQTKQQEVIAA